MTFFTNMSHELRTPLTLILGPVQRLKASLGGNEELLQMIGIMENNGERLLRIVNQLLDFRKIETGNAVMEIKETDLSSLVARVAGYFEDMASRKHISVNIDTPGTILLRLMRTR